MKIKRFQELVCWKAARSLVKMIYNVLNPDFAVGVVARRLQPKRNA